MIPQVSEVLKQDFQIETITSRTFRMNLDTTTINGTVDQREAVLQAVYLILNVERYEWLIYSWNYGVELRGLIGKPVDFCMAEIERRIREALLQDDRITAVQDFDFEVHKRQVTTTFTVYTIFGNIDVEKVVEI